MLEVAIAVFMSLTFVLVALIALMPERPQRTKVLTQAGKFGLDETESEVHSN